MSMGEGNFRPTHNPHPLTDHQKFVSSDYVSDSYGSAKFGANPSTGGFWANRWNITKIFYLFLNLYLFPRTHLQVIPVDEFFTLDGSNDVNLRKDVLLGFRSYCSPFGREIHRKHQFWGVNRRFQAKRAKYWKFHIIETTASILTEFGKTIETVKWSSWVVPIGTQ